jgi:SAM-dependent methyltransferase
VALLDGSSAREARRLRDAYDERSAVWQEERFRSWHPGNLHALQERRRVFFDLLRKHGHMPLADKRLLDVGCGTGKALIGFIEFGARPDNLYGIDLLEEQIEVARQLGPHLNFQVADATHLPFDDGFFDIAFALTTFSSMLDHEQRVRAAAEMQRVVAPSGAILWYDLWMPSPSNDANEAISLREVKRLFPGWKVDARRVTLLPPIARSLAPVSWRLASFVSIVPLLRTHWLALLTRP